MFSNGPRTVTTGLSLLVDAADPLSYPGSGTSWTDIVTGITGSLSGSITYASDFKGALVVNNSSSVIIFPTSSGNFGSNSFTVELAFQPNQINGQHWLVAKNSGSFPSWGAFITGSGGSGRLTAFFNISSTVSCSMSTPTGSIVTGSNYLVDINFAPSLGNISTIYLNSELSASITPNGTGSLTTTSSLFISNRNSGSSVGIPSEIFNAKLYTPRLVPGAIRQNYNSLSTRLNLPTKPFLFIGSDGLLNIYPGASAAFSVRLLNGDYGGPAIRVRRSSDNTEQDIGFVGGNLDTTSLLTFVGGSSGFVTTWYDQSGNGRNATQGTAISQPLIVNSGSIIFDNNKPALDFDGTNDFYNFSNITPTSQDSIFMLGRRKTNSSNGIILSNTGSSFPYFIGHLANDNYVYRASGITEYGPYNTTNQDLISAFAAGYGPSGFLFYVNNTQLPSSSYTGNSFQAPWNSIGSGNTFSNAYAQELIIYSFSQLTNRNNINTLINSYYQIY